MRVTPPKVPGWPRDFFFIRAIGLDREKGYQGDTGDIRAIPGIPGRYRGYQGDTRSVEDGTH